MSARLIAKVIVVAAAVAAAIYVLYLIRSVIWLLVVAVFVGVALGPAVDLFQARLRMRRGFAILATNNVLQRIVYRRTVALHPLIVLVGVLIGAQLLGVLGVLLAIPVAGAIQIVVKDWWRYRRQPAELSEAIATP